MKSPNPRVSISLTPSTHAQLRQLSHLTGNSQSALVAEILEQSGPVFSRLITVLSAAHTAKQEALDRVSGDLERAQARVEKQLGLLLDDFEGSTAGLISAAEQITRRGRGGVDGDAQASPPIARRTRPTPISNRGVRSSTPNTKVHTNKPPGGSQ